jgi:hypothetical protein
MGRSAIALLSALLALAAARAASGLPSQSRRLAAWGTPAAKPKRECRRRRELSRRRRRRRHRNALFRDTHASRPPPTHPQPRPSLPPAPTGAWSSARSAPACSRPAASRSTEPPSAGEQVWPAARPPCSRRDRAPSHRRRRRRRRQGVQRRRPSRRRHVRDARDANQGLGRRPLDAGLGRRLARLRDQDDRRRLRLGARGACYRFGLDRELVGGFKGRGCCHAR